MIIISRKYNNPPAPKVRQSTSAGGVLLAAASRVVSRSRGLRPGFRWIVIRRAQKATSLGFQIVHNRLGKGVKIPQPSLEDAKHSGVVNPCVIVDDEIPEPCHPYQVGK